MAAVLTYTCPSCGAPLTLQEETGGLHCEFCLSDFTEEEVRRATEQAEAQQREEEEAEAAEEERRASDSEEFCAEMQSYHCPNCGAEVIADKNTAAQLCYYCHSPIICTGRLSGQRRPDRIIPFRFDREEAQRRFLAYASRKFFVPRDFFRDARAENVGGIYYPFWVTDADTAANYRARATRVFRHTSGNRTYITTKRYLIERQGDIHFEDIVTAALSEADKDMLEGVLPYPSEELAPFSMPCLSGYVAKRRDIEREAVRGEVVERMHRYAAQMLRDTVQGYTTVDCPVTRLNIQRANWEYALLPIWMMTYKSRRNGKTYSYSMNGSTGKVHGVLPVSRGKLAAVASAIGAALAAITEVILLCL